MPTPGIIDFPTALDTPVSLIEALNNASSTLTANISVGDLLIPVADPGKFPNSGFATLTDHLTTPTKIEIFIYNGKSGSNLVVPSGGRGAQGTTAQAFSTGHFVEQRPTARHHTALRDLLIAIETKLGIGGDTPGAAIEALFSNGAGASVWRAIAQADIAGAIGNLLRKDDAALQTIISNLTLSKDSPLITLTDTTGAGGTGIINVNENLMNIGRSGQSDLLIALLTGVFTFGQIPLLPGSNPTTANQAVRKQYVDDTTTPFSLAFFIADAATYPLNNFLIPEWVVPPNTEIKVTQCELTYNAGSASGVFTVEVRKRAAGVITQTFLASFAITSALALYGRTTTTAAPLPFTLTAGDSIVIIMTTRSSPLQQGITVSVMGTNKRLV